MPSTTRLTQTRTLVATRPFPGWRRDLMALSRPLICFVLRGLLLSRFCPDLNHFLILRRRISQVIQGCNVFFHPFHHLDDFQVVGVFTKRILDLDPDRVHAKECESN